MLLATWNVNSIRARLDRLLGFLEKRKPDVVCLQELKVADEEFPALELQGAGYHAAIHGQKTYNGVAILAREPPADVAVGLGDGEDDPQARLIAATVSGVRVLSAYVPNGKSVDDPAFAYKLRWLARLRAHLSARYDPGQPLALAGDFNVAPDDRDVYDPVAWEGSLLCHPDERAALGELTGWGLTDVFRSHHPEGGVFSWWDYRMLAFPKNRGLRIDLVLTTAPLAARCTEAFVDREMRKGQKPSDHAPVVTAFA